MAGNTFGEAFRVTTFGESHGIAVGAVIDGCPAGVLLARDDIQAALDGRKPGGDYATPRKENDEVIILSGVFEGYTTGTPIAALVYNENHNSADYSAIRYIYRPGHADYTYHKKYGIRDYRGGGRASGRETIGRVIGGAVAGKVLSALDIRCAAHVRSIGDIEADGALNDSAKAYLDDIIAKGESAGGVVECVVNGCPVGLGEPVFDKLDADIAKAVMSIGAVKGVEMGAGFAAARMAGSESNKISGGTLGGISDGRDIVIRAAIKPTPSIKAAQTAMDINGESHEIFIGGRHDPVIAPRACVVIEAMVMITIADHVLRNTASQIKQITDIYRLSNGS